jgi:hypothetical protein
MLRACEIEKLMPQPILVGQTPLDTLVISQIAEIRKREIALQERLGRLSPQTAENEQVSFAEEMWHLQRCADRLNRMMDAMGGCSSQVV